MIKNILKIVFLILTRFGELVRLLKGILFIKLKCFFSVEREERILGL